MSDKKKGLIVDVLEAFGLFANYFTKCCGYVLVPSFMVLVGLILYGWIYEIVPELYF